MFVRIAADSTLEQIQIFFFDFIWMMTEVVDPDVTRFSGRQDGEWFIERETPTSCQLCELIRGIRSKNEGDFQEIHPYSRSELYWPLKCQLTFNYAHDEVPTRHNSLMHVRNLEVFSATTYLRLTIRPMLNLQTRTINQWDQKYTSTVRRSVRQKLDLERIASWIRNCDKNHVHAVDHSHAKQLPHFRLIDIMNKCIVEAHTSQQYAALSYTWDRSGQYCLSQDNIAELSKARSLTRIAQLKPVLKDAMLACEDLGIPYLWCDALCVIQDDLEQKATQIRHMDVVYSTAYLTIVAAGPEDAHGLSRVSRPNTDSGKSVIIAGHPYMIAEEPGYAIDRSKWATRAWTFQELVLSHRLLFFTQSEVIFSCSSGTLCESIGLQDGPDAPLDYQQSEQINQFAKMKGMSFPLSVDVNMRWMCYRKILGLLSLYVIRDLSHQSDYLNAFTGILRNEESVIGPSFWGLPKKLLARALLWDVESRNFERKREERYTMVRRTGWPTWSWFGWSFRGGPIAFRESLSPFSLNLDRTCLLVQIYRTAATSTSSLVNRELYADEESEGGELVFITGFNQYLLENGINGDQSQLSPHLKPKLSDITLPLELSQLLFFSASVGHFKVSRTPVVPEGLGDSIGIGEDWRARRHCSHHEIYSVTCSDNRYQTHVELNVEWRSNQLDVMDFVLIGESWTFDSTVYLHAMLIERVGGICYRVAIPEKMRREQWLYGNPRTEAIVLG